jgi:hypothetical protein
MTANLCFGHTMHKCLLRDNSPRVFLISIAGTIITFGKLHHLAASIAPAARTWTNECVPGRGNVLAHLADPKSSMSLATAAEI